MRMVLVPLLVGLVSGCGDLKVPQAEIPTAQSRTQIVVTSQALFEITKTLVGQNADAVLIVPTGTSSPDWSPKADDARTMQQAGLVLISGAGYEPWKDRVSLPQSRVRDTAAGYYDQLIRLPDAVTHQHGPDGSHSHPGTVWATWLDPDLCAAQVHQVSLHCVRLMPDQKQEIETAEAKLSAELNRLNAIILSIKAASEDKELVVYSDAPNYSYLTRRFGWKLRYLHWRSFETLTDADQSELLDHFKSKADTSTSGNELRLFLLDSRHSIATEKFINDAGGTVIRIDLCETPDSGPATLPDRLKQNLQRILYQTTSQ